jgi:hypothetical protein
MTKLRLYLLVLCLLGALGSSAYTELSVGLMPIKKKKSLGQYDKKNWLIGPNLGLGGGRQSFSIYLAPTMAYAFTEKFHIGSTLGFNYFQQTFFYNNYINNLPERYRYKLPVYSLSAFGRYHIANMLVLNVEPQLTWAKFISNFPATQPSDFDMNTGLFVEKKQRALIPSFLVGGGYAQHIGRNAYSFMMVNYDLIQNPNSIYFNTLDIRFGLLLDLFN